MIARRHGSISVSMWGLAAAAATGLAAAVTPVAGLALGGVAALALVLISPWVAVPLLVGSSALSRVAATSGDAQIRVELLIVVLLSAALTVRLLVQTLPLRSLGSPVLLPLLAYLGLNLLSTLLFAPERTRGLKLDAEILADVLTYVVVTGSILRRADLDAALRAVWVVTVGEAAAGVLLMVAYMVHVSTYGVQLGDFGLPMAYGTSWEANIFGSFLLGNFFLLLGDYLRRGPSTVRSLGLVIVLAGIAASLTRTVWLGLILGAVLFVGLAARGRGGSSRVAPILLGLPVLALAGLVLGSATPLAGRLLDVVNVHSSSASGRLVIFNAAIADWRQHPLLGSGTGSFNFGAAPGQAHPWLPNLFLLTLHDTGVLGMLALALLVVVFFRLTWRSLRLPSQLTPVVAGSMAGFAALLVAFLTTSGFWFAYPWILVGLGVAAARQAWQDSPG